jgi:hypothetical protein
MTVLTMVDASVRCVDVEPDIAIALGRDERMVWLQGEAEIDVGEMACCPIGYPRSH